MINILHLRDTDRVCGPGKTIIETACALNDREFATKVGAFVLDREGPNLFLEAAARRGIEVLPIRTASQWDPRIVNVLLRIIREHKIDIVHAHEYKSDLLAYAVSRLHRVPIMATVHGLIRNNWKNRVYIGLDQVVLKRFDRVVAVSEETRRMLETHGLKRERLVVIHNGIVVENYARERHPRGFLRGRLALPKEAVLIGNVGRLSPEKGQRDFLTAAAAVARSHPSARFLLIGSGPDQRSLEDYARSCGIGDRVFFTGHLEDVRPSYADLDVLALTSHTEGFPNVVLEALCMGVPVLATAVGGVPEIIEDGTTGVLVAPHQPGAVAEGLRRLLEQPLWGAALADTGRRRVVQTLSFAARVAKEEKIYRELAAA